MISYKDICKDYSLINQFQIWDNYSVIKYKKKSLTCIIC